MSTLYDQDAGVPIFPEVDRRSTARRSADRSIIADQAETIRALEGRLTLAKEHSGARLELLKLAVAHAEQLQEQLGEAVALLREVQPVLDVSGHLWEHVDAFLAGLES
jgi:hypothetical protein